MIVMKTSLAVALLSAKFESQITGIDWFVIAIYFSIMLGVAGYVVKKGKDSAADYFLAGRNLGWWIIGASIFASNIGSEHVVGLAGAGATSGVALAHYELHAWCLLVLAWDGGSLARSSLPRTLARNTSWVSPAPVPQAAWPWPTMNCMPGACWCWLGFLCRSTCVPWSLPCQNFWSAASARRPATFSPSFPLLRSSFPKLP